MIFKNTRKKQLFVRAGIALGLLILFSLSVSCSDANPDGGGLFGRGPSGGGSSGGGFSGGGFSGGGSSSGGSSGGSYSGGGSSGGGSGGDYCKALPYCVDLETINNQEVFVNSCSQSIVVYWCFEGYDCRSNPPYTNYNYSDWAAHSARIGSYAQYQIEIPRESNAINYLGCDQ